MSPRSQEDAFTSVPAAPRLLVYIGQLALQDAATGRPSRLVVLGSRVGRSRLDLSPTGHITESFLILK